MNFIHIEAVNFANTVFDTQDISTIRGASRAIEDVMDALSAKIGEANVQRFGGGQFTAEIDTDPDELLKSVLSGDKFSKVARHLIFVTGRGATHEDAEFDARKKQFRQWTITDPGKPGHAVCKLDHKRPAVDNIFKASDANLHVSQSVADRWEYGRGERYGLRPTIKNPKYNCATQSFEDLIFQKEPLEGVSEQSASKIAVIHADGSDFGKAREAVESKVFSTSLKQMQTDLLAGLTDWMITIGDYGVTPLNEESRKRLSNIKDPLAPRIEVLMFGGEDMDFVIPAWLIFPFIQKFYELTKDWKIGDVRLYNRLGAIVANYKTPIRQMRALAEESVDIMRGKKSENVFAIDYFTSAVLPEAANLTGYRGNIYGRDLDLDIQAQPMKEIDNILADLRRRIWAENDQLSRSQIYKLVGVHDDIYLPAKRRIDEEEKSGHLPADQAAEMRRESWHAANDKMKEVFASYSERIHGAPAEKIDTHFAGTLRSQLIQLALSWPYVTPELEVAHA